MPTGAKIKEIRIEKGLTQKQLGDMCGMADSAIRRYENGNANPKIETLQKIADALGMPLYDFLDNDLFDAATIYPEEYEENLIDSKIDAIMKDISLSETEKKKKLHDISTQVAIMAKIHIDHANETTKFIICECIEKLNSAGQNKAIEQVEMLTKIPEYRRDITPD